jgi:hypothetical protein
MKLKVFTWLILIIFFVVFPTVAQENSAPVIDSTNIRQLQSVAHLDFADVPAEAGTVDKGWVAVNANGDHYATVNRGNEIVLWSLEDGFVAVSSSGGCEDNMPGAFIDGLFYNSPTYRGVEFFTAVYASGNGGIIAYHPFQKGADVTTLCGVLPAQTPLRIWTNELAETWTEVVDQNSGQPTIHKFPIPFLLPDDASNTTKDQPITPDSDPDSFLRIGRIDPPLAITATKDALLKRWNLETGEVTASVQLDGLPAAGQVNSDGSNFAWVDQKFGALHLLNFESKVDKVIAPLGGTYIPFLLLSAKADVIIGVNVGLEPNVTAWDVATNERIDLGGYRVCNRQPDMVRLSKDGSTLVVGCDTGLDIWRIPETL